MKLELAPHIFVNRSLAAAVSMTSGIEMMEALAGDPEALALFEKTFKLVRNGAHASAGPAARLRLRLLVALGLEAIGGELPTLPRPPNASDGLPACLSCGAAAGERCVTRNGNSRLPHRCRQIPTVDYDRCECGAAPGTQCFTRSGNTRSKPHPYRTRKATAQ